MNISVVLTYEELKSIPLQHKVLVVVDVLRATTTMTYALHNKAASIISVSEVERAVSLSKNDSGSLLCGERNGEKISGFDKGNSPSEYEDVEKMNLIFSSTNGSKTIELGKESKKMYLGAIINASALVATIVKEHKDDDIVIACSGKAGAVCIEDSLCAGYLVDLLTIEGGSENIDDPAKIVRDYYSHNKNNLSGLISSGEHGKYLIGLGVKEDVDFCSKIDIISSVACYNKESSKITLVD